MSAENGESIVGFDAERALEAARRETDDAVQVCAEYTPAEYRLLHVADAVRDQYDDDAEIVDLSDLLHKSATIDFTERDTLPTFYPMVDETLAFVTYTDLNIVIRVIAETEEALYLSVDRGTEITPAVEAVSAIVNERAGD